MSNAQFKAAFAKLIQQNQQELDTIGRRVAQDFLARFVYKSPVGNPDLWKDDAPPGYAGGRFRGNWNVSVGSPDLSTSNDIDPSGGVTMAKGQATIRAWVPSSGRPIFLTNNLPYAMRIEYGWSTQAPSGIVRTTLREYGSMLQRALKT